MTAAQLPGVNLTATTGPDARILVVDDDPNVSGLVGSILGSSDFTVEFAADAGDALNRLTHERADLVILDLMLPGTDGLEACRQIRARLGRSIAILMVSARGRAGVIDCLAAGADDYLAKPFDVGELEARVRTLLRARALEVAAIRRSDRLLSLQRISAAVVARPDEDEILDLVLAEARRLLKSSGVAMYEWDAESELLRPRRMSPPEQQSPPLPRRAGEGLVGRAFEARAPLWLNQYDAWSGGLESAKRAGVVAGVAAPLLIGDETLGIIVARKTGPGERVDEEDAQVLGLLATHAAVGMANARAYALQREAADRAASRAAELEALLESMTDGVLLVDEAGTVTSANRAAATILGREPGTLAQASLGDLLAGLHAAESGDAPAARSLADLALALRESRSERELVGEVGGFERVLALLGMPVGGQTNGTLLVLRDVTDRRQSEARSAQAEKLRALGQLASGVAHDVNNLLAAVLGRAELARMEVERGEIEPERLLEALGEIEQAADDGARTVRRIQEFARDRTDADVTVIDLAKLIRDTVDLTRPSWGDAAQAAGTIISLALDLAADLLVAAEPLELREVLTNLILNAVDAMPRGGELRIVGQRADGMVRIDVADTGVGMSREVIGRVFEPFFTTKVEGGTGLGLAVAYGVVRRRGGHLSVASVPDGGTTFTIELPYAGGPAAKPAIAASVRSLPDRRRHILFVDDEAGLASIVQRLLLIEGFDVTICAGGEEALATFDPTVHDLVLTDYGMPDINGVQVAAAVRRFSPQTPVVLITGWGSDLDASMPPAGVTAVIGKPFRLAALVETVRTALAGAPPPAAARGRTDTPGRARSG